MDTDDDHYSRTTKLLSKSNVKELTPMRIKKFKDTSPRMPKLRESEAEIQKLTKSLLNRLYKNSMDRYTEETEKLEKTGKVEHLKANHNFRKSIKTQFDPEFEKKLNHYERRATREINKEDI